MKSFTQEQPQGYIQGLVLFIKFCGVLRTISIILCPSSLPLYCLRWELLSVWDVFCSCSSLAWQIRQLCRLKSKPVVRRWDGQRKTKTDRQSDRQVTIAAGLGRWVVDGGGELRFHPLFCYTSNHCFPHHQTVKKRWCQWEWQPCSSLCYSGLVG